MQPRIGKPALHSCARNESDQKLLENYSELQKHYHVKWSQSFQHLDGLNSNTYASATATPESWSVCQVALPPKVNSAAAQAATTRTTMAHVGSLLPALADRTQTFITQTLIELNCALQTKKGKQQYSSEQDAHKHIGAQNTISLTEVPRRSTDTRKHNKLQDSKEKRTTWDRLTVVAL